MKNHTGYMLVSEDEVLRERHDWKLDTVDDMQEAIMEGMPYRALYTYSNPLKPNGSAPFMYGDLWLVTSTRKNRFDALEFMRRIVEWLLAMHSDIEPGMLHYYLDTSGTVYLRIPAPLFYGEHGAPLLPFLHRQMAEKILAYGDEFKAKRATCMRLGELEIPDLPGVQVREDVYDILRPFMFLEPGLRQGNSFTVEVDYDSFMNMYPNELLSIVKQEKKFDVHPVSLQRTSLCFLYDSILLARCERLLPKISKESLSQCPFFESCMEHPETVDEKKKELMFRLLAPLGKEGRNMALELGERMPGCTEHDMRLAFYDALNRRELVTCAEVAQNHGCDGSCGIYAPYDMREKEQTGAALMEHFQEREDGLYYSKIGFDVEDHDELKVCSPIFSTARVCNADGTGWEREVRVKSPDGKYHEFTVPLKDCMSPNADKLLRLLCEHGLELAPNRHAATLLKLYFRVVSPPRIKVGVESLGWVGDCYVLPDIVIGHYDKKPEYLGEVGAFRVAGTLDDWISRIGCYCVGNPLLQLIVQFALTGPFLKPGHQEGGGLHIHGPSSTGKTTMALVAGSVWGGGPGKGYLNQWRTTDNALERTAARHNDGLLVMDEIAEAKSDTVAQVIYMLTNGQGKERLKSNATANKAGHWRTNYLSTGEVPTSEKIEAGGRNKVMAGQEVRTINLPANGPNGENVFKNLHGFPSPAALSDHLKRASKEVYGRLIRAFLAALCGSSPDELHANVENILRDARRFEERVCPSDAAGQVRRVAIKFGLMAAVGAFAARHSLLPWSEAEAVKVAEEYFQIWLDNRGGIGNLEVENAIKALLNDWELRRESHYDDLEKAANGWGYPRGLHGYYRVVNGELEVYIKSKVFSNLIGTTNRNEVLETLKERGMLILTNQGTLKETQAVPTPTASHNVRIVGIRPEAMLKKLGEEERLAQASNKLYTPSDDLEDDMF